MSFATALVRLGRAADGLLLLDEAMAYATGGGLGPLATGLAYGRTLSAWLELCDYRRAMEWSEAILRRGPEIGTIGFPGDCHTHRAAVLIVGGQWEAGEREVLAACQETAGLDLNHAALAYYQLGELRLRQGDLDATEASFRHAHELGADPHPGLAVLQLARGDAAGAAAALRTSLAAAATDPLRRAASPASARGSGAGGGRPRHGGSRCHGSERHRRRDRRDGDRGRRRVRQGRHVPGPR